MVGNKLGTVEKMHTREQAEYGRDAFVKVYMGIEGGKEGERERREGEREGGDGLQ